MKKILYMVILAAAFSACSEDFALAPALSFHSGKPEILEETAIFRMVFANMADSTERRFPVTFGGTAERGVDYEVSSDAFIFGGENPLDSIVVTTLKFGTQKTMTLTVDLPEDMEGGYYLTSEYELQDYPAYITFGKGYRFLTDSTMIDFSLTDRNGKAKKYTKDIELTIKVNTDRSTAGEGADFSFADSSHFTIRAGENQGQLKLKRLKEAVGKDMDKIVFSIEHDEKFGPGEFREMEISLMDTIWNRLDGKWNADSLLTDAEYMKAIWGDACSGYDLFPRKAKSDNISFDMENCTFKPFFIYEFDNYFADDSDFRKGPVRNMQLPDGSTEEIQTFLFSNTNRYFSKNEESEDKESYVGMRIIKGIEETPDTLDMYIIDYVSKTFMPELETSGKYAAEKPTAASPGMYINYRFVK